MLVLWRVCAGCPCHLLVQVEDQMNATTFSEYLEKGYYRNDGIHRWGAMRVVSMPETLTKLGACNRWWFVGIDTLNVISW